MHRKIPALIVSALILAGFSFLAVDAEGKDNGKKPLQGTWLASKGDKKAQITFDGDKFTFEFGGKSASGTFTIDPGKSPKQINMTITKGSDDETKKYEGKTAKGIYEIDGNKLKWCVHEPGGDDRPAAFPKDGDGTKALFLVLEREKK